MSDFSNKKVAVVLSGCGVYDGSEIHETVLTILHLDNAKAKVTFFSPDREQHHVINHNSGEELSEKRNVLVESARIARGEVKNIKEAKAADFDALIFPGGFGAAKNLCDFAFKATDMTVCGEVERFINEMHAAKKPIGFICIAPVIAAKVLGKHKPSLTIGTCTDTAGAIESLGAKHVSHNVDEIETDEANKIVTTPAYMLGPNISNISQGIEKLVMKVLEL